MNPLLLLPVIPLLLHGISLKGAIAWWAVVTSVGVVLPVDPYAFAVAFTAVSCAVLIAAFHWLRFKVNETAATIVSAPALSNAGQPASSGNATSSGRAMLQWHILQATQTPRFPWEVVRYLEINFEEVRRSVVADVILELEQQGKVKRLPGGEFVIS